jgi:hypothetical protein
MMMGRLGEYMNQQITKYIRIYSGMVHKIIFLLCLLYPASIIAQQGQAVVETQNPAVYDNQVPLTQQDDGMPYYHAGQDIAEPPPGPYQALPDLYPPIETGMYPDQQVYSMPPIDQEQGMGLPPEMPAAPPVPGPAYTYPQYTPPPQAAEGSRGYFTNPPQYGGQRQGYPAYEGGNYGYYQPQPPAYRYPPQGEYQYRAPQGYQGYYQGQPSMPPGNPYGPQRAYPPSGYAYPPGSNFPVYPNRNPDMRANPPKNTGK